MSSILRNANVKETGLRKSIRSKVEIFETKSEPRPSGLGLSKQYELSALLSIVFWANDVERADAVEAATKALNHAIYRDALVYIAELRSALIGDDAEQALRILSEFQNAIDL